MFTETQGRKFMSAEFHKFARGYQFEFPHLTPTDFHQSNEFIESMDKIVKPTISKAEG